MLTLFATFNWCVPVASQSKHSSCVFPWRFLMLDESTTVVDHHVCVKPLAAKVSATYHVSSSSAFGFFVSIKITVLEYCKWTDKMLWTQQADSNEPPCSLNSNFPMKTWWITSAFFYWEMRKRHSESEVYSKACDVTTRLAYSIKIPKI